MLPRPSSEVRRLNSDEGRDDSLGLNMAMQPVGNDGLLGMGPISQLDDASKT